MSYEPLDDDSNRERRTTSIAANGEDMGSPSKSRFSPLAGAVGGSRSSLSEPLTNGDLEGGVRRNHHHDKSDPFYVFREDLYRKLELVDEGLAEYLRVVYQTDSAVNGHELKDTKKQLRRHMKNAESTLKDVQMTVQVVEGDRESKKFAHISDAELYERRSLVQTSRDRLGRAKQEMTSEAVKAKLLSDERAKALRRATPSSSSASSGVNNGNNGAMNNSSNNNIMGATTEGERENSAFIVDSQARTSLLFQQQDETLDDLDVVVTRVGVMAENIHGEITEQNKQITEMQEDLADAEEQLGLVMGKLAKFLKTKDTWQLGTIVALFFTVVILLFLVIYF